MTDTLTRDARSERMGRIKGKDTKPEMRVRQAVHAMGYRYRLHDKKLPGVPDLVFKGRRKVIFVHGCFWHVHEGCKNARLPKSRVEFWRAKLNGNKVRDERAIAALSAAGWQTLVIWECELRDMVAVTGRIKGFLGQVERR